MASSELRPFSLTRFVKRHSVLLVLALVLLLIIGGYIAGWRIGPNGLPVQGGTMVLTGLPDGTNVFVDQARRVKVSNGVARTVFTEGTHSVIVDAPKYQPWNEVFAITSGKETRLAPVLVLKEPTQRTLEGDEAAEAARAVAAYRIPTKETPLMLENGCAAVYVLNNRVVAEAVPAEGCTAPEYLLCPSEEGGARTLPCPSATGIFPPVEHINGVVTYPGREDALVVAAGGAAYVIELDPREPQFFAPLGRGANVRVAPHDEHSVFIAAGTHYHVFSLPE